VRLNNGIEIPQLGFGVFRIPEDETVETVLSAIETGYRSIDTASLYGNERGVGRAVTSCGVAREELFITTKLWNDDHGYESALRAFDESLARLGLEYVDLYLIHWPVPAKGSYIDTWRALERLYAEGRARAIGVSNFQPWHLRPLLDETDIVPAVNQVELHPQLQQDELRKVNQSHGIVTEAWSPLAKGGILAHPVLTSLAGKYEKTPAQIVLRWHVELGNVVIPKSATTSRIKENIDVFDFTLADEDLDAIRALESGTRTGPDPDSDAFLPADSYRVTGRRDGNAEG
jgi:diketogulonate reductase-like aldo/keto reductase